MQKLTRREWVKLAATTGLAALLGALASGIDPEEKIEELEQPTEEPRTTNCLDSTIYFVSNTGSNKNPCDRWNRACSTFERAIEEMCIDQVTLSQGSYHETE